MRTIFFCMLEPTLVENLVFKSLPTSDLADCEGHYSPRSHVEAQRRHTFELDPYLQFFGP